MSGTKNEISLYMLAYKLLPTIMRIFFYSQDNNIRIFQNHFISAKMDFLKSKLIPDLTVDQIECCKIKKSGEVEYSFQRTKTQN